MVQITICGGGNAAHALAGILSTREDLQVNVYAPFAQEAPRWKQALEKYNGMQVIYPHKRLTSRPFIVSADPAEVLAKSHLILLALPAFAHEKTLQDIAPIIAPGAWIGALPARGGFDWSAREILGGTGKSPILFGLQTLPWACRIAEYGREVAILGTKKQVDLAIEPSGYQFEVAAKLEEILDVPMEPIAGFLDLNLAGTGQLVHPGIMYGLFHHWSGAPYPTAPAFYQGVDEETADLLICMSEEVQLLRFELERQVPGLDLTAVRPLKDWILRSYATDITDSASLRSCFVTNRSYAGLLAPMKPTNDGLVPDFKTRYLSEDIPFGLVVTRGIAELAQVVTPTLDKVIVWSQEKLNKEYIRDGRLRGRDVANSRAPQRYGINQLSQLIAGPKST